MEKIVSHQIFDQAMNYVTAKKADFYVKSYTKIVKVSASTIKNFAKDGLVVLSKAQDGKGYVLLNGKNKEYVFHGQLVVVGK